MRIVFFAAAFLAATALTGCGDIPRGSIHGTVKYQGKPLTDSTVIFIAKDNQTHPAVLKADGSYEVHGVAQGLVKVSVQQAQPRVPAKAEPGRGGSKAGVVDEKAAAPAPVARITGPRLPAQYTDPDKSGQTFELKEADQEWSVDLK